MSCNAVDGLAALAALAPLLTVLGLMVAAVSLIVAVLALWRTELRGPQPRLLLMSLPREANKWSVQAAAWSKDRRSVLPIQVNPEQFKVDKANGLNVVAGAQPGTGTLLNDGPRSGNVWDLTTSSDIPKPWTILLSISPDPPLAVPARGSIPVTVNITLIADCLSYEEALRALDHRHQVRLDIAYTAHRGPSSRASRQRVKATLEIDGAIQALEKYLNENREALGKPDD